MNTANTRNEDLRVDLVVFFMAEVVLTLSMLNWFGSRIPSCEMLWWMAKILSFR